MSTFEDFRISPKYKVSDWIKVRAKADWNQMISIFQDRLEGRFLNAIDLIRADKSEIGEYSGFSVMALDCLIIETLKQFHDGIDETPKNHEEKFRDFF